MSDKYNWNIPEKDKKSLISLFMGALQSSLFCLFSSHYNLDTSDLKVRQLNLDDPKDEYLRGICINYCPEQLDSEFMARLMQRFNQPFNMVLREDLGSTYIYIRFDKYFPKADLDLFACVGYDEK